MWEKARNRVDNASPTLIDYAAIIRRSGAPEFEIRRGGVSISSSVNMASLNLLFTWNNGFPIDIDYQVLYGYVEPTIGVDVLTYSLLFDFTASANDSGVFDYDASSIISTTGGDPIYIIALAESDVNNDNYPNIEGSSCLRIANVETKYFSGGIPI